jgi:hypothetical protein
MPINIDELLTSANEIRKQSALKEAEKAEEHMRLLAAAEAEKKSLIDELTKPSGLSEEEKVKRRCTGSQTYFVRTAGARSTRWKLVGKRH